MSGPIASKPNGIGLARAAAMALAVTIGLLWAAEASRPAPSLGTPPARVSAAGSAGDTLLADTSGTTLPAAPNPTPATTVVPIQNQLPAPPVTLPLTTRQASTSLNPVLAKLSIAGFALFLLLLMLQLILTRRGRRGRWTL
jgi:hypothetical protein